MQKRESDHGKKKKIEENLLKKKGVIGGKEGETNRNLWSIVKEFSNKKGYEKMSDQKKNDGSEGKWWKEKN